MPIRRERLPVPRVRPGPFGQDLPDAPRSDADSRCTAPNGARETVCSTGTTGFSIWAIASFSNYGGQTDACATRPKCRAMPRCARAFACRRAASPSRRPWPDPVIDEVGHDPRSAYVETFWLAVLGPPTITHVQYAAKMIPSCPPWSCRLVHSRGAWEKI